MSQPRFLLRYRPEKKVVQADTFLARWPKIYKSEPMGNRRLGGVYGSRLIDTGKIRKDAIDIRPRGNRERGERLIDPDGTQRTQTNWVEQIGVNAADVKAVIRAIRPEEAERLDALDEEIADLQARLKKVRETRAYWVQQAWVRGHVVRLAEVKDMVEEP